MLNNVNLIGYLGSDAQSRTSFNGVNFVVLSLAMKRNWKDRETGEWQSQTSWLRCVLFGSVAQWASSLTKGQRVQVAGYIQTRNYIAQDGSNRTATEIRVQHVARLDRAPKSTEVAA